MLTRPLHTALITRWLRRAAWSAGLSGLLLCAGIALLCPLPVAIAATSLPGSVTDAHPDKSPKAKEPGLVTNQSELPGVNFRGFELDDSVAKDMALIDHAASQSDYGNASAIIGKNLRARDEYRRYLKDAEAISTHLMAFRKSVSGPNTVISLQQLGAQAQQFAAEQKRFRSRLKSGESQFHTFQLIDRAIRNLVDAGQYWRASNRYRPWFRSSRDEKATDNDFLTLKLQTAIESIDALNHIFETRKALSKGLEMD